MSFKDRLESLRAKPEHVRKRFAFLSSLGITVIIFAFWLGSFNSFGASSQKVVATAVNKAGSPSQAMLASVGSLYTDIKELIFGAKKITYSNVEVLPGKK